jgi:hypothetical protein
MSDEQEKGFVSLESVLGGLFSPEMLPARDAATTPKSKSKATKASVKIRKAAAEIAAEPNKAEAAYLARELVQCTLPHRDPGKVEGWVRSNGNFSLVLQPGFDSKTKKSIGLPYGPLPRLLLLWIVTEAIRTKSRAIKLSDTLNEFLREIGLDPNTGRGPRGDATRLKEQMKRLFNCRISFQYSEGNAQKGRSAFLNMEVAQEGRFWWDFKNPEQGGLFESEIVLGEVFFKAITAAPVPLDMRAVAGLMRSPLAIDLYTWATYRIFTMQRAGSRQIKIPISELKEQFGSEYNRIDNFKTAFSEALERVKEVFPALDYTFEKSALILRDSRQRPAIAPTDKTAAQRRLAELKPFEQVSDKAREQFKQDFPRWDADVVIADFHTWREEKGQHSANTDAHFKAFARSWVERNK